MFDLTCQEILDDADNASGQKIIKSINKSIHISALANQWWLQPNDIAVVFGEGNQDVGNV